MMAATLNSGAPNLGSTPCDASRASTSCHLLKPSAPRNDTLADSFAVNRPELLRGCRAVLPPDDTTTTLAFLGTAGDAANTATTSPDNSTVAVYVCSGTHASRDAGSASLVETLTLTGTMTPGWGPAA